MSTRSAGGVRQAPSGSQLEDAGQPVGQSRQLTEGLLEDRRRASLVGVAQRRARQLAHPEMIVLMGVGVPGRRDGAQAAGAAKLGEDQRDEMLPAAEAFIVGIPAMGGDGDLERRPRDRFEKAGENAIPIAHARLRFLVSTTRK